MLHRKPHANTGLIIRQATRKDLDAIGDLWVELMAFHAALDHRFRIPPHGRSNYIRHVYTVMRDSNYHVLVAQGGEKQVMGYILAYIAQNPPIFPHPRYGFIADLCISEAARRQGIGEALLTTVLEWFRSRGMENIQLNVAHHNAVSQAFWRKMGCTDYLDHMWLSLSPPSEVNERG
jgi:ribosomal protein S18 acetylase RimI-like enzyme